MKVWVDAQLSPALAKWMCGALRVEAFALREVGLRDATDREIFFAARTAGAVVLTKDSDFAALVETLGPPPQILWLTIGNTSNVRLRDVLTKSWPAVVELLRSGERLVELQDA